MSGKEKPGARRPESSPDASRAAAHTSMQRKERMDFTLTEGGGVRPRSRRRRVAAGGRYRVAGSQENVSRLGRSVGGETWPALKTPALATPLMAWRKAGVTEGL